jgi:hypothetical protein
MTNTKQIGAMVQDQTLDAVRKTQDAAVKAVAVWTDTANKVPGVAELAQQWPSPTAVIDSSFDFAQRLLDSQRDFAGRIVAATTTEAAKPEAASTKAVTAKPVAAGKSAPRKKATAAKKSSTARGSATANR